MSIFDGLEGVFVTGTDTGIGKSFFTALLICATQGSYWKPVQSGIEGITDSEWLQQVTGLDDEHFYPERYIFSTPCSPHLSASKDGLYIDLKELYPPAKIDYNPLIVEGAGGIMVPLNNKALILDLIKQLNYPVILVAGNQLGTINHTLLSLSVLRQAGLKVLGVVLNGPTDLDNKTSIEQFGSVKILAELEWLEEINPETISGYGYNLLR